MGDVYLQDLSYVLAVKSGSDYLGKTLVSTRLSRGWTPQKFREFSLVLCGSLYVASTVIYTTRLYEIFSILLSKL